MTNPFLCPSCGADMSNNAPGGRGHHADDCPSRGGQLTYLTVDLRNERASSVVAQCRDGHPFWEGMRRSFTLTDETAHAQRDLDYHNFTVHGKGERPDFLDTIEKSLTQLLRTELLASGLMPYAEACLYRVVFDRTPLVVPDAPAPEEGARKGVAAETLETIASTLSKATGLPPSRIHPFGSRHPLDMD